jgi:hypothetical protein
MGLYGPRAAIGGSSWAVGGLSHAAEASADESSLQRYCDEQQGMAS